MSQFITEAMNKANDAQWILEETIDSVGPAASTGDLLGAANTIQQQTLQVALITKAVNARSEMQQIANRQS